MYIRYTQSCAWISIYIYIIYTHKLVFVRSNATVWCDLTCISCTKISVDLHTCIYLQLVCQYLIRFDSGRSCALHRTLPSLQSKQSRHIGKISTAWLHATLCHFWRDLGQLPHRKLLGYSMTTGTWINPLVLMTWVMDIDRQCLLVTCMRFPGQPVYKSMM